MTADCPVARPPLVSVVIPTYRPDPRHLADLVSSVANSTYGNVEIVLVDDASPNAVALQPSLTGDIPTRVFSNSHNIGMVGNWNEAVRKSNGELVLLVGQDDVLDAMAITRLVKALTDNNVVAVSNAPYYLDGDGRRIFPRHRVNHRSFIYRTKEHYFLGYDELRYLALRNGAVYGEPSCVLFRRRAFDEVAGFNDLYGHAADVDFALRLSRIGPLLYLTNQGSGIRWHENNLTRTNRTSGVIHRDRLRLFADHGAGLDRRQGQRVNAAMASFMLLDFLQSLRRLAPNFRAAKLFLGFVRRSPGAAVERLIEQLTRNNLDAR